MDENLYLPPTATAANPLPNENGRSFQHYVLLVVGSAAFLFGLLGLLVTDWNRDLASHATDAGLVVALWIIGGGCLYLGWQAVRGTAMLLPALMFLAIASFMSSMEIEDSAQGRVRDVEVGIGLILACLVLSVSFFLFWLRLRSPAVRKS